MGFFDDYLGPKSGFNPITAVIDVGTDYLQSREARKATQETNEVNA